MKRLLLPFCLALALAVALPGSALAHANPLRSDPAPGSILQDPPQEVRLWFNEPLEPGFSLLQVLDSTGGPVDLRDSRLEARDPKLMVVSLNPLGQGYYTVAWRALSRIDGHITSGSFSFSVGTLVGQPAPEARGGRGGTFPPAEPGLRWLTLLGVATLAGGFALRILAGGLPPLSKSSPAWDQALGRWRRNTHRVVLAGLALTAMGSLGGLLQQAWSLGEGPPNLASLGQVLGTRWGLVTGVRLGLLSALFLTLRALSQGKGGGAGGMGLSLGLLLTLSLNGHAAASGEPLILALDILHGAAAALYLGGLFHLWVALLPALRGAPGQVRGWLLQTLIPRFSALALGCVGVLLLTGVYAWWVQVGVLGPALDTGYGQALLAKALLLVPLLALGALNLLYVRPRLRLASVQAKLLPLVRAEGLLGLLVLLTVGFLTTLPPARQELSSRPSPIHFGGQTQGVLYHGQISPGQVGWNTYQVWLWDEEGNPLPRVRKASLRFTFLSAQLGRTEVPLEPSGPGSGLFSPGLFSAQGSHLSLNGPWRAELTVQREDAYDLRLAINLRVPNTLVSPTPPRPPLPWRRQGP